MTEFFQSLSKDFSQLLENSDDFNVIIRAGDEHNEKTFYAHSVVLRTRSPYFHTALSSDWARKEGNSIVFIKPNTTPIVFDLILRYVYSGRIDLSGQDNMDILDLLITADELLLEELFDHVQHYLLDLKTEWVKKNVVHVHRAIHSNENCNRLKNFCLEIICKNPLILFKSKEFYSFDETLLIPLLERDNLQIEEIEIWNYLIKWGVSQMSSSAVANLSSLKSDDDDNNGKMGTMDMEDKEEMVMVEKDGEEEKKGGNEQQEIIMDDKQIDISNWDKKEFIELERLLHNCIPLIRFFQITANDFHDNILQFSQILPKNLFDDILKFHLKRSCLPNLSVSSISKLIPNTKILPPRSLQFDSTLLKAEQVARLADWIDRKDGKGYTYNEIPYKFKLLVRGSLDGFDSEVFHEKCDHKGPTVVVMQIAYSGELVGGYNPLEWSIGDSRLTTQNSFLFSFPKQGNLTDGKVSRVTRFNYAIRIKDKSHGPCFGDKDLWMKNNFNGYDSCSSDKDDYLDRVTTLSKFWVIEYEVFQVIKK